MSFNMRLLVMTLCALLAATFAYARSTVQVPSNAVLVTGRKQIEQLVQLNEGQAYTLDRATLIKMLDEALATARPRTD
jgi:hypothetical protein